MADRPSLRSRVGSGVKHRLEPWRQGTARWRVLPDYLVLGAMKAGTTSFRYNIRFHPWFVRSAYKQPAYFDHHYDKGERWYRGNFPLAATMAARRRRAGGAFTGEESVSYLYNRTAAPRVAKDLPDARLIALLRDPVRRTYSHHQMELRWGRDDRSFDEAMQGALAAFEEAGTDPDRVRALEGQAAYDFQYIGRSVYAPQLAHWYDHVDRERLLVLRAEDFFEDTRGVLQSVHDHLGIPRHDPETSVASNVKGGAPKMAGATRDALVELFSPFNDQLERLLGRSMDWDLAGAVEPDRD
ncbi:MAG: sulfotransferase [Thermoplasmatota archaeon]